MTSGGRTREQWKKQEFYVSLYDFDGKIKMTIILCKLSDFVNELLVKKLFHGIDVPEVTAANNPEWVAMKNLKQNNNPVVTLQWQEGECGNWE